MEKLTKSQVAKAVFLLILLLFIPFVSSSLRHSYLYFLLNILIVALGLEAGFLKAISRPHDNKRTPSTGGDADALPVLAAPKANATTGNAHEAVPDGALRTTATRKTVAVKKVDPPRKRTGLRRCPSSKPSIFFIGGGAGGEEGSGVRKEETKWEGERELSKQELFAKAEDFIGNFYMQLRMQREESWKKIHGFIYRPN